MKKFLGLTAIFMSVFAISTALADTEDVGDGNTYQCGPPWDNICMIIYINGEKIIGKGTLIINP